MMADSGFPTSPDADLAATLREVEEVRRRTRATVHQVWFPMVLFGVLGLLSIPAGLVADGIGQAVFWAVAGPAGGAATAWHYRNRALSCGAGVRGRAYAAIGAAIFVVAWVGGALTESAAVPMLVVAIGYIAFARLDRSWPVAVIATALGVAAVVVGLTDPAHGDVVLTLVFGVAFTATGLLLRRRDVG